MWHKLINIFSDANITEEINFKHAIAAILVRAAKTDNQYTQSEIELIDDLLCKQLKVDYESSKKIRKIGEVLETEINDNVQLTRIIKKDIAYEDREELIQRLWSIVLDDYIRTPEENKFMRVLTHLLGVSDVNSAKARSRVLKQKNKSN